MRTSTQCKLPKTACSTQDSILLTIIFFITSLFSCTHHEPVDVHVTQKNLIINFIDPSGTAIGAGWPNPTMEFYTSEITWLENNGGGSLCVFNSSLEMPTEISVEIQPLKKEQKAMEVGEVEYKRLQEENNAIKKNNESQKQAFFQKIQSGVIDYDPETAGDLSYLDKNIFSVLKKIKEPAFGSYNKYIFLYTDLINEPGNGIKQPVDSVLISELSNAGADISLCLLVDRKEENRAVKQLKAHALSSYQDFNTHLISKTKHN